MTDNPDPLGATLKRIPNNIPGDDAEYPRQLTKSSYAQLNHPGPSVSCNRQGRWHTQYHQAAVFISLSFVTNCCGRSHMLGVLYPIEAAISPTKLLQLDTDACQTFDFACSCRIDATTLLYSACVSRTR